MSIKQFLKDKRNDFVNSSDRKRLTNKDFTIISDNCWGGQVYTDLGIEYRTPFVGLIVFSPDYLRLVKDLRHYLSIPLTFTKEPKYKKVDYPVGILDDVEIYFMHYKDENEALEKWNRRLQRMNWDNIFIKINDRDQCSKDILEEFDNLDYNKKIIFTAHEYNDLKNHIWFKEYSNLEYVEPELKTYKNYFDVVDWLNEGGDSIPSD